MKDIIKSWNQFMIEGKVEKLKLFFLIGPPSVGKSHWLKNEGPKHGIVDPYIISMDEVTDMIGDKHGFDYDQMFAKPIQPGEEGYTENQHSETFGEMIDQPISWKKWEPKAWSKVASAAAEAVAEHDSIVSQAKFSGKPIVVDMTNMSAQGRKRLVTAINAPDHELIAVTFGWNNDTEYLKKQSAARAKKRFETTGRKKTIPPHVLDRMVNTYEKPSESEGWDKIISVPAWWTEK